MSNYFNRHELPYFRLGNKKYYSQQEKLQQEQKQLFATFGEIIN